MKKNKLNLGLLWLCLVFLGQTGTMEYEMAENKSNNKVFAINIKAKSLVLGPEITLGEIGNIYTADIKKKNRISKVKLGLAPPPGESTEISLSFIKQKLRTEGLDEFIPILTGPKRIRVITAQNEIDKAFLREELANNTDYFKIYINQLSILKSTMFL